MFDFGFQEVCYLCSGNSSEKVVPTIEIPSMLELFGQCIVNDFIYPA